MAIMSGICAVILTHAHLDHSGYLPLLVRKGYEGRIHATPATRDLCAILLPDSGHIQEEDARFANRHGFSKHHPAERLYTRADTLACMPQFKPMSGGNNRLSRCRTGKRALAKLGTFWGPAACAWRWPATASCFRATWGVQTTNSCARPKRHPLPIRC